MKKMLLLGLCVMGVVALTGCVSYQNGNQAAQPSVVVRPVEYQAIVETKDELVTGTATENSLYFFFPISWGDGNLADRGTLNSCGEGLLGPSAVAMAKQAAVYNACKKAGCDALVYATYEVEIKNYIVFKQVVCTVKGYPCYNKGVELVK